MTRLGLFSRQRTQAQEQATPLPDQPDPTMPSPKRQKQLEKAYVANIEAEKPPYAGVRIATLGELLWILRERNWKGGANPADPALKEHMGWFTEPTPTKASNADEAPSEQDADPTNADLRGADVHGINLDDALLDGADLRGALFMEARLRGVALDNTLLMETNFTGARLLTDDEEQHIQETNSPQSRRELLWLIEQRKAQGSISLHDTNLSGVNLDGLDLTRLDLTGARLISETQETTLQSAMQDNIDKSQPPCQGIVMTRLNEVIWIRQALENREITKLDLRGAKMNTARLASADLSSASMDGVHLQLADLRVADLGQSSLVGAHMTWADLSYASAIGADLRHAALYSAYLVDAKLTATNLSDADLSDAIASRAVLHGAQLFGTNLHSTKLEGANLRGTRMSTTTQLYRTVFDMKTRLGNITWGGTQLTTVNWKDLPRLGEDLHFRSLRRHKRYTTSRRYEHRRHLRDAYEDAIQAYSVLERLLQEQGRYGYAAHYRLRRLSLMRQMALREHRYLRLFILSLAAASTGYGTSLILITRTYIAVIVFFAAVYAINSPGAALHGNLISQIQDATVESIAVFHGFGFAVQIVPGSQIFRWALVEAFIGFLMQGLIITTLTRNPTES